MKGLMLGGPFDRYEGNMYQKLWDGTGAADVEKRNCDGHPVTHI